MYVFPLFLFTLENLSKVQGPAVSYIRVLSYYAVLSYRRDSTVFFFRVKVAISTLPRYPFVGALL